MFFYSINEIYQGESTFLAYGTLNFLPRIGETIELKQKKFKVTNIIYELDNGANNPRMPVRIEVTRNW